MHPALLALVATWIGVSSLASGRSAPGPAVSGATPTSAASASGDVAAASVTSAGATTASATSAGAACTPGDYRPCLCPRREGNRSYEAYDGKLVCSDDGASWSSCTCR